MTLTGCAVLWAVSSVLYDLQRGRLPYYVLPADFDENAAEASEASLQSSEVFASTESALPQTAGEDAPAEKPEESAAAAAASSSQTKNAKRRRGA